LTGEFERYGPGLGLDFEPGEDDPEEEEDYAEEEDDEESEEGFEEDTDPESHDDEPDREEEEDEPELPGVLSFLSIVKVSLRLQSLRLIPASISLRRER
jgi:stringent starvation protein B